jgi:small subunit ribosomal protein S2
MFEEGVEGRTKYEISKMKVEWTKLNRLYEGIKDMKNVPSAVVVVDPRYEVGAVIEARKCGVPVVGIVDTNSDPDMVDYVVPANDDAISSISIIMNTFASAVKSGNGGQGIKHNLKDYSKIEVNIIKNQPRREEPEETVAKKPRVRVRSQKQPEQEVEEVKREVEKVKPSESKVAPAKQPKNIRVSSRVQNILKKEGLTITEAKKMSKDDLLVIKGLGETAIKEILK